MTTPVRLRIGTHGLAVYLLVLIEYVIFDLVMDYRNIEFKSDSIIKMDYTKPDAGAIPALIFTCEKGTGVRMS